MPGEMKFEIDFSLSEDRRPELEAILREHAALFVIPEKASELDDLKRATDCLIPQVRVAERVRRKTADRPTPDFSIRYDRPSGQPVEWQKFQTPALSPTVYIWGLEEAGHIVDWKIIDMAAFRRVGLLEEGAWDFGPWRNFDEMQSRGVYFSWDRLRQLGCVLAEKEPLDTPGN